MKSFIHKIGNTSFGIIIRKLFNIRPASLIYPNFNKNVSISDAFFWRTDNNFTTILRFSDLLKFFFNEKNSFIKIEVYSKDNNLIKEFSIEKLQSINEFIINKEKLDNFEGYGSFYIFHKSRNNINNAFIRNSCYTGYTTDNNYISFVHGNTPAVGVSMNGNEKFYGFSKSLLWLNSCYKLQNFFEDFEKTELCFTNPMNQKLKLKVNDETYVIKKNCSILIDIGSSKDCTINSNCSFLRPVVFNYLKDYFDVYHG